jgi:hypothetical protein
MLSTTCPPKLSFILSEGGSYVGTPSAYIPVLGPLEFLRKKQREMAIGI